MTTKRDDLEATARDGYNGADEDEADEDEDGDDRDDETEDREDEESVAARAADADESMCPDCGELMARSETVCPGCGYPVKCCDACGSMMGMGAGNCPVCGCVMGMEAADVRADADYDGDDEDDDEACPVCGESVDPDDDECPWCGTDLEDYREDADWDDASHPRAADGKFGAGGGSGGGKSGGGREGAVRALVDKQIEKKSGKVGLSPEFTGEMKQSPSVRSLETAALAHPAHMNVTLHQSGEEGKGVRVQVTGNRMASPTKLEKTKVLERGEGLTHEAAHADLQQRLAAKVTPEAHEEAAKLYAQGNVTRHATMAQHHEETARHLREADKPPAAPTISDAAAKASTAAERASEKANAAASKFGAGAGGSQRGVGDAHQRAAHAHNQAAEEHQRSGSPSGAVAHAALAKQHGELGASAIREHVALTEDRPTVEVAPLRTSSPGGNLTRAQEAAAKAPLPDPGKPVGPDAKTRQMQAVKPGREKGTLAGTSHFAAAAGRAIGAAEKTGGKAALTDVMRRIQGENPGYKASAVKEALLEHHKERVHDDRPGKAAAKPGGGKNMAFFPKKK